MFVNFATRVTTLERGSLIDRHSIKFGFLIPYFLGKLMY